MTQTLLSVINYCVPKQEFRNEERRSTKMKMSSKKLYTRKRPAHPDEAHTTSKRWFKKKGRKAVRKHLKQELERSSP